MKISQKWLSKYIEKELSVDEISDAINFIVGAEVDQIIKLPDSKIVVAKIEEIKSHPNADKLHLVKVFNSIESKWIVCGANNIKEGQVVPLAEEGAEVSGFEIKKANIRGVESCGMLCSQKELSLGDDHQGIMILDENYQIGASLNQYKTNDTIFEIEVTPNRGDLLSHFGIARELSAIFNQKLTKEPISLEMTSKPIHEDLKISVTTQKCTGYFSRKIDDIKIDQSPNWLKELLITIGQNPINNVVDITNYIMYDLGQPLHAFDAKKISKGEIIVRTAQNNEELVTLDDEKRCLKSSDIVITDASGPIALAGVIGGKNSEIDENTTSVVLESAEFDPTSVRKTAKHHKISSEAAYRFERGIDSKNLEYALNKATYLINKYADGNIQKGIAKYEKSTDPLKIKVEYQKINSLLGTTLLENEIDHHLKSIGFVIENKFAIVPSWRHDINCWQDLAEEVARLYGYKNITDIEVKKTNTSIDNQFHQKEAIKDIAVDSGFSEIYNYPFMSKKDAILVGIDPKKLLTVINPVQPENLYLRSSLIPNLLKIIAKNNSFDPILIFQIAQTFDKKSETSRFAAIAVGNNSKEYISNLYQNLFEATNAKITTSPISDQDKKKFKIRKNEAYCLEFNIDEIKDSSKMLSQKTLKIIKIDSPYKQVSKFPPVNRDLAFIIDSKIKNSSLLEEISSVEMVSQVELFDEFSSDKFGKNKKSLAFHIKLQSDDHTLNDEEARVIVDKIVDKIKNNFKAILRDK